MSTINATKLDEGSYECRSEAIRNIQNVIQDSITLLAVARQSASAPGARLPWVMILPLPFG